MNRQARTHKMMIMPLLVITMFLGPADALTEQALPVVPEVQFSAPASTLKKESILVATSDTPSRKKKSLLPERAAHSGVRSNLFAGHSWYTPPPPAPVQERPVQTARAPSAPPLPFDYIGRYEQEGEDTLYYLVKDDRVYDVKLGDVIDGTYSVEKVSNGQLVFTYLPLNTSQGLRLGDR